MSELFVPDRPLHAVVGVELFDARTGRKVDESVGENYITPVGLAHNRWKVRNDYMASMPGSNNLDVEPLNPFSEVWLSDSTAVVDTNSSLPLGSVLAWANKSSYVGADVYRGNPNSTECEASASSAKWVFDWPTHAGNGTIGSVGWRPTSGGRQFAATTVESAGSYWPGITTGGALVRMTGETYAVASRSSYLDSSTPMQKFTYGPFATAGAIGPTPAAIGFGSFRGVAEDGTYWYVVGGTAVVKRFTIPVDLSTPSVTNITVSGASALVGAVFLGGDLWVADSTTKKVSKINATTGAVISEFTVPNVSGLGSIASADLLAVNHNGTTSLYDTSGVVVVSPVAAGAGGLLETASGNLLTVTSPVLPSSTNYQGSLLLFRIECGSRVLLPSPVTKSSLQTMKLTYTFTYA